MSPELLEQHPPNVTVRVEPSALSLVLRAPDTLSQRLLDGAGVLTGYFSGSLGVALLALGGHHLVGALGLMHSTVAVVVAIPLSIVLGTLGFAAGLFAGLALWGRLAEALQIAPTGHLRVSPHSIAIDGRTYDAADIRGISQEGALILRNDTVVSLPMALDGATERWLVAVLRGSLRHELGRQKDIPAALKALTER